jgi:hypothetical protein
LAKLPRAKAACCREDGLEGEAVVMGWMGDEPEEKEWSPSDDCADCNERNAPAREVEGVAIGPTCGVRGEVRGPNRSK